MTDAGQTFNIEEKVTKKENAKDDSAEKKRRGRFGGLVQFSTNDQGNKVTKRVNVGQLEDLRMIMGSLKEILGSDCPVRIEVMTPADPKKFGKSHDKANSEMKSEFV